MKTPVRLGLTGVAGAVAFFAANRVLRNFEEAQQHKFILGGILVGLGMLTWAAGKARRATAARDNPGSTEVSEGVPFASLQFWGPVVALCGGLIAGQARAQKVIHYVGHTLRTAGFSTHARESGKARRTDSKKSSPVSSLKLQGIFYRKAGSSALIDGQTVAVGDWIGAAQVTAIDKKTVTMEVSGTVHKLKLKE